jgi:hypothetical protein
MNGLDLLIDSVLGVPSARRGRPVRQGPTTATIVRELTNEDIQKLWTLRSGDLKKISKPITKLKHAHHMLARLIAAGVPGEECHLQTGYTTSRQQMLKKDPAFQELISYYKTQLDTKYELMNERLGALSMDVVTEIQERLEESPENFTNNELNSLLELSLDRTGHGPTSNIKHTALVGLVTSEQIEALKSELNRRRLGQIKPLGLVSAGEAQAGEGTSTVQFSTSSPWKVQRLRGAKARGLTYQKKAIHELERTFGSILTSGRWISFIDRNGPGFAQPDAFLQSPHATICFECKLTLCEAGRLQIQELYRPLLRALFGLPVVGVLMCRNLTCDPGAALVTDPHDLLTTEAEHEYVWHFLG